MVTDPKPGDTVLCRVKEGRIVSSYAAFDSTESFQVIASDYWGFYIYVPDYIGIDGTSTIDKYTLSSLNIRPQFLDCRMLYINSGQVVSVRALDGCACSRCGEFFMQAQADADGNFTCFLCRTYQYR